MTLEPLFNAPIAIQIHVLAVMPAALLGAYILLRQKGTPWHRLLGKIWLGLMVLAALSSFFIHRINMFFGFSPIHILSVYVLVGSWRVIVTARRHDIRTHRRIVIGLYLGGIIGAGLFTLLPGRIMNEVVSSGDALVPLGVVATIAAFFVWLAITEVRKRRHLI
jgi:uncharacterized membrane protein